MLTVALALLIGLDLGVRHWLKTPDLVIRNEGRLPNAVPYHLLQMKNSDQIDVAWAGSSVLQGLQTTTPETTAPHLVKKLYQSRGFPVRSYNLSHAGNILADNYALSHAAIRHGADAVVFEIVYGLFPGRGVGQNSAKKEFAWYMRDLPEFTQVRQRLLQINDREWLRCWLKLFVTSRWALLENRGVILTRLTGRHEELGQQIGDRLMVRAGMPVARHGTKLYVDLATQKNVDHYWKQMPVELIEAAIKGFRKKIGRLRFLTPQDRRVRILARTCRDARENNVPILFYLSAINRELLEKYDAFNPNIYNHFRNTIRTALEAEGCDLVDLTDSIESRHFTDSQHLNVNGHRELAKTLAVPLAEKLNLYKAK